MNTQLIYSFSIVILHWNRLNDTLECLESVYKIDYPNFEILLVDNGSTDGSLEEIKRIYPNLRVLENGENLGFAEGCNRGIQDVLTRKIDFIFLLNNDTVVDPHILKAFAASADHYPQAAAFGAKIFYYDEPATLWYAGGSVDSKSGRCYHIGCGEPDGPKYKTSAKTDYACGCALVVRATTLEKIGLFSPEFFLLWEEIDWCYRARKMGYESIFVQTARVWHKISSSFPEGNRGPLWQYYYHRNRLLFHKRHSPRSQRFRIQDYWDLFHLEKEKRNAAIKGIKDYLLGRFY